MYLYPRGSRHWDWPGTTAYLGPRVAAEWAQGVHLGYALLCGCGPESLGSGAETVLLFCPLTPLLLLRTLTLHLGLALWSHGCSGAQRGPSGIHGLCVPPGWNSTNLPHPEIALW